MKKQKGKMAELSRKKALSETPVLLAFLRWLTGEEGLVIAKFASCTVLMWAKSNVERACQPNYLESYRFVFGDQPFRFIPRNSVMENDVDDVMSEQGIRSAYAQKSRKRAGSRYVLY